MLFPENKTDKDWNHTKSRPGGQGPYPSARPAQHPSSPGGTLLAVSSSTEYQPPNSEHSGLAGTSHLGTITPEYLHSHLLSIGVAQRLLLQPMRTDFYFFSTINFFCIYANVKHLHQQRIKAAALHNFVKITYKPRINHNFTNNTQIMSK